VLRRCTRTGSVSIGPHRDGPENPQRLGDPRSVERRSVLGLADKTASRSALLSGEDTCSRRIVEGTVITAVAFASAGRPPGPSSEWERSTPEAERERGIGQGPIPIVRPR
jgi:hypothetical protein